MRRFSNQNNLSTLVYPIVEWLVVAEYNLAELFGHLQEFLSAAIKCQAEDRELQCKGVPTEVQTSSP